MTSAAGQSSWPVIRTCLPKISSSRAARACGVDVPGQPQVLGLVAGQLPGDDAAHPGSCGDLARSRPRPCPVARRVLPRAKVAASSSSFLPALASVVPSNPRAWAVVQLRGVGQDRPALGAVDVAAGVVGGQPAEPVLVDDRRAGRRAGRSGPGSRWRAPTRCSAAPSPARCAKFASEFCPASNTTVMSAAVRPGRPRRRPPRTGLAAGRSCRGTG